MLYKTLLYLRSFILLYAMLYIGERLATLFPVGIPASIFGLLVLFVGLTTQLIKLDWIYCGASLLNRYMAVLFAPISVGIIEYADLLLSQAQALVIPNIISTLTALVLGGILADYLFSLRSFTRLRKKVLKKRVKAEAVK
ncbi:MAG: CidA/LrgA family protein [Lonepinella koalarum]|nr:CidA/LrgA family protein [Lonepinella koalarum]